MTGRSKNQGGAAIPEEPGDEFYRPPSGDSGELPSYRLAREEADAGTGEPFLRTRRRVPVRRGLLPRWARTKWGRPLFAICVLAAAGVVTAAVWTAHSFLLHDPRFRIASASDIQTLGNTQLTRGDLLSVFGQDIGRNLFTVPMAERRAQLRQIPWVENATVMRILPDQLRVAVVERTPVAFAEVKGGIELVDASGVLLQMPPQQMAAKHYSFPVITGLDPGAPAATRAAQMALYQRFLKDLDSGGQNVSSQISEVDLSDPSDVKATVTSNGTDLLLYFGQEDFLARWRNYQSQIAQWRAQYPHLASVDLRYKTEVVLKMADQPETAGPAAKPAAAKQKHAKNSARPAHKTHAKHKARRSR